MKNVVRKTNIVALILAIFFLSFADVKNVSAHPLYGPDDPPSFVTILFWSVVAFGFLSVVKKEIFDTEATDRSFAEHDSSSFAYQYIFPPKAYDEFINLENEELRQTYIDSFWHNYFSGSHNTVKDLRKEFEMRIDYANENYSELSKKGWRTDRGRIYIIYGSPADIIYNPVLNNFYLRNLGNEWSDMEVWYYQRPKGLNQVPTIFRALDDGRMFFVFTAPMSGYKYEQIFSTELREKSSYFHY